MVRGFSFVLASAAAGSVLEFGGVIHSFCFSFFGTFLPLPFHWLDRSFCQAAIRFLAAASALTPMAQINPSSSRPTAVTIFLWSLPAAASLE